VTNKKLAKGTEASITIPLPKGLKIELRLQRGSSVYSEKIKRGETKVFFPNDGCLIVHYCDDGKVRVVFTDKTGKIKGLTEI